MRPLTLEIKSLNSEHKRVVLRTEWDLPPREVGEAAPVQRPYVPFEGRSTAQDDYVPKYVGEQPTFGRPSQAGTGAGAPTERPYVPFEGESVMKSSYPYVPHGACVWQRLMQDCKRLGSMHAWLLSSVVVVKMCRVRV